MKLPPHIYLDERNIPYEARSFRRNRKGRGERGARAWFSGGKP
ncbi:MAG: hypothetical protein U0X92_06920 [Anaerolineales bacterium]